jgi:hypothetical protein
MTTKTRVKDLETRIEPPNDEKCYLVIGLKRDELPKCRKGRMVSLDLHECEGCAILPKNRNMLRVKWLTAEDVDKIRSNMVRAQPPTFTK